MRFLFSLLILAAIVVVVIAVMHNGAAQEDLKQAGRDLKSAASEASTEIKPTLERVKQAAEDTAHHAATKMAGWTETGPASRP